LPVWSEHVGRSAAPQATSLPLGPSCPLGYSCTVSVDEVPEMFLQENETASPSTTLDGDTAADGVDGPEPELPLDEVPELEPEGASTCASTPLEELDVDGGPSEPPLDPPLDPPLGSWGSHCLQDPNDLPSAVHCLTPTYGLGSFGSDFSHSWQGYASLGSHI
jgi:hypothetical protein